MARRIALLIILTVAVLAAVWHPNHNAVKNEAGITPTTRCEEDESCWDCRVDGNRICGPTTEEP